MSGPEGFRLAPRHAWDAACWITPFLLLWWMAPFLSDTTLGNDYPAYSIQWQLELMTSWEAGAWPLYVPGFCAGQSAGALSLGQLHHPLPHLASWMPGYWSGYALEWMTFWRLVTLGGAHWVWFRLLRRLGWRDDLAFLVTLAAVHHLRMLDCFRYGAALEAYTGMLFLCAALAWLGLDPRRTGRRLAVAAATYWLVTSGHPQFSLFGAMAAAGWAAVWPFVARTAAPESDAGPPWRAWLMGGACMAAGAAMSAWFLLPYYAEFVRGVAGRAGGDYAWSLGFGDTVTGTLAAFSLPLRSDVHGAFGGTTLVALPLAAPGLLLLRPHWTPALWCAAGAAWLAILYALGDATPVHGWVWELVPLLARTRAPGRISMVWPVLLLAVVIIAHAAPAKRVTWRGRTVDVPPLAVLAGGALAIALLSMLVWVSAGRAPARYAAVHVRGVSGAVDWMIFAAGCAGTAALGLRLLRPARAAAATGAACTAFALQLLLACYWGSWTAPAPATPTLEAMLARRARSWEYPHRPGAFITDGVVVRQAQSGVLEPRLAWATTRCVAVPDAETAFTQMAADRPRDTVWIVDPPKHSTANPPAEGPCHIRLVRAGYNQLRFECDMPGPGWLVTNLPFTGRWQALETDANGETIERPVRAADGLGTAVWIAGGRSTIDLYYVSTAAIIGVVVSTLALVLFGVLLSLSCESLRTRAAVAGGLVCVAFAAPTWWFSSLYAADLGHRWEWRTPPPDPKRNLAYGKRVTLHRPVLPAEQILHYGGRAVDGRRDGLRAIAHHAALAPALDLDLARDTAIGAVHLHDPRGMPLTVFLSSDGLEWRRAGVAAPAAPGDPLELVFPPGTSARYLRLQSQGAGSLSVAELEVFPP